MENRNKPRGINEAPRVLLTPEQAKERYSPMAGEILGNVLEGKDEDAKRALIADTVSVIAGIVLNYGGHYRRTSPDVSWSALKQGYSRETAGKSASGRFMQALGNVAGDAYKTAFAMLEAGVETKEELDKLGKPPKDELEGLRSGPKGRWDGGSSRVSTGDAFSLVEDLPESPLETFGIELEPEEQQE